jgi:hypothetical protein
LGLARSDVTHKEKEKGNEVWEKGVGSIPDGINARSVETAPVREPVEFPN